MPQTVVVASKNPIKILATKNGFEKIFGDNFIYYPVDAPSQVNKQPSSDNQTLTGAKNRIKNAKILYPGADFYVGLEGGVEEIDNELHEFAWIVVERHDGKVGKGKTCTFIAPEIFREMVSDGMEVGDISDIVFGEKNSKQDMGAIGLLTRGAIDRAEMYRHAVIVAMMPFLRPDLY